MGCLRAAVAEPGTKLKVKMLLQKRDAVVTNDSPFDPESHRIRSDRSGPKPSKASAPAYLDALVLKACLEAATFRRHVCSLGVGMTRRERRFQRQFDALERLVPPLRGPMSTLRRDSWFPIRFPVALLLIAGGLFSFLPVLGIWMLPLGLLLLAVDLPILRGPISAVVIRARRKARLLAKRWKRKH
jgi:hypothetical protein